MAVRPRPHPHPHPKAAKSRLFISPKDETGSLQAIVWPNIYAVNRSIVLAACLLAVRGEERRQNGVSNLLATHFEDLTLRFAAAGHRQPKLSLVPESRLRART